ncbi:PAS domain S-box protein [Cesiribacter sp. SM1]|uniref:hybrid sensor histidine kinase/response regulator n=1 Tax=Cesiribacter sp. SM1 TaxID=2861196 RepID=UPI001CD4E7F0|nr:PAS domain S-box protein [Cesiribacter sp. SM1]
MQKLKLLLIEDSENDELLLLREFNRAGYKLEHQRVQSAAAMAAALQEQSWDIVISDFQMPQFSGMEALSILSASELDIPFIIISGAIGEETAVEAIRSGATDYLMKENLSRLIPAVERAMRETNNRRQRTQAERKLEEMRLRMEGIIASAMDAIITVNIEHDIVMFNRAAEQLFEYSAGQVLGKNMNMLMPERYRGDHSRRVKAFSETDQTSRIMSTGSSRAYGLKSSGFEFPIEASISQLEVNEQKFFTVIIRDITERIGTIQKLAEEKQRLELALIGGNLGMWDWMVPSGKVVMNEHWAVIMGFEPGELQDTIEGIARQVHPEDQTVFQQVIEEFLQNPGGYFQHEYRTKNRAGDWRWVQTSGKVLDWNQQGEPIRVVGTHQDITERKLTAEHIRRIEVEMLNFKIAEQRNQSGAFLRGQEEERKRLARELHDGIGQHLNVLKIQLSMEKASSATRQSVDHIINEINRINNNLMPLVLQDYGLEAGIRQLIERFKGVGTADFYYYCDLQGERFSQELEIAAFRIVQEATGNAVKYADAANISVQLIKQDEYLLIMVEDDGVGFSPAEKMKRLEKGFGLLNMQYRAETLNGKFLIESNPGSGCLVNVILPINS